MGDRSESERLFEQARSSMAGGVSHESRYAAPYPKYIARAKGAHKWDADGNEYVDYAMGSASQLLGHAHPDIVAALSEQAANGVFFADCHEKEVEWSALIQKLVPSAERVRFVGSGTEATMLAIRIARAYRDAGPDAVAGFRKVMLGVMSDDEDRRRFDPTNQTSKSPE